MVEFLSPLETSSMLAVVPHPYTHDDWLWFFDKQWHREIGDVWAIAESDSDRLMGIISLHDKSTATRTRTIGFWLGAPYRRQGVMKSVAIDVLEFGFHSLDLEQIDSGYFNDNGGSAALHEKLGFEFVGEDLIHCRALGMEKKHTEVKMPRDRYLSLYPSV